MPAITDAVELQRLKERLEGASDASAAAERDLHESQADATLRRNQFFEKLAFGCGAVIAAMVSFLGNHVHGLHPAWLLRTALLLLVLCVTACLYRGWRYPGLVWLIRKRHAVATEEVRNGCKRRYDEALTGTPEEDTRGNQNYLFITDDIQRRSLEIRIVETCALVSALGSLTLLACLAYLDF